MIENRWEIIEKLTGIHSSKKSYYVELKKKIEETAKRNAQLEIINELARSINIEMSLEEIMESVTEKLSGVVNFDRLSLYTLEGEKLILKISFPKGPGILAQEEEIGSPQSVFWEVIREQKSLLRTNITQDEYQYAEDNELAQAGIKATVFIPLLTREGAQGVLVLKSRTPFAFSQDDLVFLEQFANQLAVCFKNVRLYGEVLKAKREWEETFRAVTDLLFFIDPTYKVIRFNKSVPTFFRLSSEQIERQKCYEVFFKEEKRCSPCPAQEAMQTGKRSFHQLRLPTGEVLDAYAYPAIGEDGHLDGAIIYAKDVTQLVSSSKLAVLGEMAAGVAHELNSPLTAIVGDAQLLLREVQEGDPSHELLQDIKNCGSRCRRIIQNLLAFSRQEEYSFEPVDLNEIVERALGLVAYQIEKSNMTLVKELSPNLPRVIGNSQRLEQVLINFLLNARDALEGVAGERKIVIRSFQEGEEIKVAVTDAGKGIPADILPNIFNPFFTTKKPGKGTGLGLSVSLGIAQAHGGTIEVESGPEKGSTFTLVLPVRKEFSTAIAKESA